MPEKKKVSKYEKPVFEKEKGLVFPKEIIQENFNGSRYCLQCSSRGTRSWCNIGRGGGSVCNENAPYLDKKDQW